MGTVAALRQLPWGDEIADRLSVSRCGRAGAEIVANEKAGVLSTAEAVDAIDEMLRLWNDALVVVGAELSKLVTARQDLQDRSK